MAERSDVPYIVAPHGSLEPWVLSSGSWRRRFYAECVERPLLQKASRMQALSEAEVAQFRAYGLRVPTAVIPNAVGEEWLRVKRVNIAAELGLPHGAQTILFLSRLHPKKGLDILLQAFAAFCSERDDITLLVAGSDGGSGYERAMRARAQDLSLGQRCLFLGEVRGDYKTKLFAGADAFVLTSHSEGLPMAVLEAMASGTPVLVTPGCNLPEVESRDTGGVVNPQWQPVLAGLRDLFADPRTMQRRGENGRRLVRERFTWPRIASRTLEVYEAMIAEKSRQVKEVA
jgi:glycosyltransferase involved in cell wall biosynthesis